MFIVMKFGGTSVVCVAALQQVIGIIRKARIRGDEVVVAVPARSTPDSTPSQFNDRA